MMMKLRIGKRIKSKIRSKSRKRAIP